MELSELIESIDIVEYISQFVDLEQRGEEYWGLSPFKPEKTPSFSVRPNPPCFFDYSSGIGGNVYTFVRYHFNCGSQEAIQILKKYAGDTSTTVRSREKMASSIVCRKFQRPKQQKKESKAQILPPNYMDRYQKVPEKLAVWEKEGISRASMDKFGVFYDSFSDRIVFPIKDVHGNIVNVSGRTLDPLWKEKKLRKYSYFFSWGTINTIYGLYDNLEEIKAKKEIILFEGCKSVLLADTWGIHNCGAILTSHLSPNQASILIELCCKTALGCKVVFALDKDVDITKDRNIKMLQQYVNVEYILDTDGVLDEKDAPVDKGKEAFLKLYDKKFGCFS